MRFRSYQKPDGWSKGQPEVLVADHVAERMGLPLVNYDSLDGFFRAHLKAPAGTRSVVDLYGRCANSRQLGLYLPFTPTLHVNALASEKQHYTTGGVMRVIAHEGLHRAEAAHMKLRVAAECAAGWAVRAMAFHVGKELPLPVPLAVGIGAATVAHLINYQLFAPAEKRACEMELRPSVQGHALDIVFPNSPRTAYLAAQGFLPAELSAQLELTAPASAAS